MHPANRFSHDCPTQPENLPQHDTITPMTTLHTALKEGDLTEFTKQLYKLAPVFLLWFVGGLALSRILYEGLFPYLLWLGRPLYIIPFALIVGLLGTDLWQRNQLKTAVLLPLLLNLIYLFDPAINLIVSRIIFFASIWLMGLLIAHDKTEHHTWRWLGPLFVLAALLPVYLLTMPDAVGQADTFEFQVVAPQLGIAHPTGYPLYLLLGKLFTLIPVNSVAWRLNFGTMIYGLTATCLLFTFGYRMVVKPVTAVLGATIFGLIPTFWSQAIEAEIYTLHTLFIALAFVLMREIGGWTVNSKQYPVNSKRWLPIALAFVLGLGMTNHLTTVFLLPGAALTLIFSGIFNRKQSLISNLKSLAILALAFLLPFLLYAYLPIRWQALNDEPMGMARFLDWVIGGRFAGALQWRAWLNDMTRYEVIGRIYLTNWGWINLGLALLGFIVMLWRNWRLALIFGLTWLGFTFYGLNYYVPDLDVFIIGAQVVVAVCWMVGTHSILMIEDQRLKPRISPNFQSLFFNLLIIAFMIPSLLNASQTWARIDQSLDDGGQPWGEGVLALPLAEGAAILADSEKIAPLYYLQQAEGIRPDLDIMVLPDEAAYRYELDTRIAADQTVYLARFLPGLEGIYHLRSLGPLTEVSNEPMPMIPSTAASTNHDFDSIQLIGYAIDPVSPYDDTQTGITLYWQASESVDQSLHVYLRLGDETTSGQHPANNTYPTNAWKDDEIVADFHSLPRPIHNQSEQLDLQVALAPPFTATNSLEWHTISTTWAKEGLSHPLNSKHSLRQQIGELLLSGVDYPAKIRQQSDLTIITTGWGSDIDSLNLELRPVNQSQGSEYEPIPSSVDPDSPAFLNSIDLVTDLEQSMYEIYAHAPVLPGCHLAGAPCEMPASYCGWMRSGSKGCVIGIVEISGVALPETAVNYNDQIALLNLGIPNQQLIPGGTLDLTLDWTALAPLNENYTIFLQVLDANDRLVGQVDAWPLQGTLPTSQWQPGETITDPHTIQLDGDLPPGEYRLLIGWYLLADLRRLPVLNEDGQSIDDKLVVPGLFVSE